MIALGSRVHGLGAAALGAVELAFGAFSADWLTVPASMPGYSVLLYASAASLIVAGLAINSGRLAGIAALTLAIFFTAWIPILVLPQAPAAPTQWVGWQAVAESTAMALGGLLAYARALHIGARRAALTRYSRLAFGVCLLVFGVSHFVYAKLTASLVPAWFPPSQLFWAWATGVAQIAAGLALLSGIQARLAAVLLAAMYVIFGLAVHLPSIIARPSSHDNWTENAINLILIGAAWTLADALGKRR